MTREQAIEQVLSGLQHLIITHSTSAASEQYAPVRHADSSDDYIREHKEFVNHIRTIRRSFEDVVTGLL